MVQTLLTPMPCNLQLCDKLKKKNTVSSYQAAKTREIRNEHLIYMLKRTGFSQTILEYDKLIHGNFINSKVTLFVCCFSHLN